MSAVLQLVEPQPAESPEPQERAQAVVSHELSETELRAKYTELRLLFQLPDGEETERLIRPLLAPIVDERVAQAAADSPERVQAAVSRVLDEYPFTLPVVQRAGDGNPHAHDESVWLVELVDEGARLAQAPSFPRPRHADLPPLYIEVCKAIAACARVDECKDWMHKGAALASYARQMHNQTLCDCARRIQLRAARQCGRLLLELAGAQGARSDLGRVPAQSSRKDAANDAGLSSHQLKQVIGVARVPEGEFEAALAASPPPTRTALAARGRQLSPYPRELPPKKEFRASAARLFQQLAIGYDTHAGMRAYCDSVGVSSRMLRQHAAVFRGFNYDTADEEQWAAVCDIPDSTAAMPTGAAP